LYVNIVCLFTALPISLKSIWLLAQQPYSGEQLAEMLGLSASTVSHHLSILAHVELVSARLEQYYNVYSLNIGALQSMAQRLLSRDNLPRLAEDVDGRRTTAKC
jgi:DNA-binding transcriptional ArsR family regulator